MLIELMLAVCIFVGVCNTERIVELERGYQLVDVDTRPTSMIVKSTQIIVDPHVSRFEVLDPYVLGERRDADLDPRLSTKFGYFVLNMKTGHLQEGLDREEFEGALKSAGIEPEVFE